ncbi:MAG: hypothetical protein AB1791_11385 [Chloroflexota bacterium]
MSERAVIAQAGHATGQAGRKLMVSGRLCLEPRDGVAVEVRRGMPILAQDQTEVGAVAAVVMDGRSQKVTHLLLGHLPPTAAYHLLPVSLIDRIDTETIWLRASTREVEKLPIHHPI